MDCNDDNIDVNPNADENCTDGIDNNCNNLIDAQDQDAVNCPDAPVCTDGDGDGYAVEGGELCGPMDCDDRDADVNPGESENCGDGVDNDCDSSIDAVDTACQARNDDDDSDDDEEEENRRGDRDDNDSRDSRRSRRSSRD